MISAIGPAILAALLSSSSSATCKAPRVDPVVELIDLMSPRVAAVGEPAGDGICELYCGVVLAGKADRADGIPLCASYPCRFTLQGRAGQRYTRDIQLGPTADGSPQATGTGTTCLAWASEREPTARGGSRARSG